MFLVLFILGVALIVTLCLSGNCCTVSDDHTRITIIFFCKAAKHFPKFLVYISDVKYR